MSKTLTEMAQAKAGSVKLPLQAELLLRVSLVAGVTDADLIERLMNIVNTQIQNTYLQGVADGADFVLNFIRNKFGLDVLQ